MLFNCSLLASGLCNLTSTPYGVNGNTLTSYEYSNWRISNCSPVQTQIVVTILDQIEQSLPSVIQAVPKSTETVLYKTFFKSLRVAPFVHTVFTSLGAGEEVQIASDSHVLRHAPAEFICPNASDATAEYHKYCSDYNIDAAAFDDVGAVILCQNFWDALHPSQSEEAVPTPTCPTIGNDTNLPDSEWMLGSKLAVVIHELIHLYVENQIVPEVYSLQSCAGLRASKAVHNANNYTFFAMSKYNILPRQISNLMDQLGIIMNCMDWPASVKRSIHFKDVAASRSNSRLQARFGKGQDADSSLLSQGS